MFRRNFFGAGPWDRPGSLPRVRLAGSPRARLGQGGNGCQIPGTDMKPVFDSNIDGSGACGVTWMDTSTAQYPECVQAPPGYPGQPADGWIPPSCAAAAPAPEPEPPPPEPEPAPAPEPTPPPPPGDYYPVEGQCPEGQFWNGTTCEAVPLESPVESTPAPTPAPVQPPAAPVSPGASVPIVPGPFQQAPAAPAVPFSARGGPVTGPAPVPQKQFAPSMRPACRTTPYKAKMFPSRTTPSRPDDFQTVEQWTKG